MVGKWHLGFCKQSYRPINRGFDTSFGVYSGQIDYFTHQVMRSYNLTDYFRNDEVVNNDNYCGDDFTNEAIKIAKVSTVTS